ncbi:MAG: S-layer homology domain-containing protein [Oscillospiraceae bacterium]|nr:S-layer homology domain-containing protein [Oscillospiraceae bacterium]
MKKHFSRLLGALLAVVMVFGLLPAMAAPGEAATNLENGFEGMDADVFTALGFDVTVLPDGYEPDTADNPFGRDKVTGNQVFELAVAGKSGSKLYGKGNNNVAATSISGIPAGNGLGMEMFASAAGDFDGDGLAGEIVYVGFETVNPSIATVNGFIVTSVTVKTSQLKMRVYNGRTETFGSIKSLSDVTPFYTLPQTNPSLFMDARVSLTEHDMYWQNLLQVTAGDYDGDGISEIAVYVGENENARIDVYKYQKTSNSAAGDWIDMANWARVWSHALNGEYAYVPNMVSLVSGDFNRDGVDDLGIAYGSAVVNEMYWASHLGRMEASKAVMLWGDRTRMLQSRSAIDLANSELGDQARVSLIKGDLDMDGAEELIATGQPVEDLEQFAGFFDTVYSGNTKRTVVTYVYDERAGLLVNSADLMEPVKGAMVTATVEGESSTQWKSENGFDQNYYSTPYMKTNAAVFFPQGAEYPYLYLDSCLYQATKGSLMLKGEFDENYDGEHAFDLGLKKWGARYYYSETNTEQAQYAEYGASAADINGNGYQILVTSSFAADGGLHSILNNNGSGAAHRTQYAVVSGTADGLLTATITCADASYTEDYQGQALTFIDCDIDTIIMEYTGQHYLTYSDPKILAVISAAPYFEDVDEATGYEFAGNNTTSWGRTHGDSTGDSVSVSFEFGAWAENSITTSTGQLDINGGLVYTLEWEKTHTLSHEYTMTFGTYGDQDAVAFYSIPTENYVYRVYVPDEKGGYEVTSYVVSNTYDPAFQVLTLDYYESIQGNYDVLPQVAGKAITSTPGDPSSYPSSTKGYNVIVEWDQEAAGVGYGNGSISQEISISSETEESYSMGAEFSFELGGGLSAQVDMVQSGYESTGGMQFAINPAGGWSETHMKGTTISAEVANMPVEFQQYGYYFDWKLFSYYYVFGDKLSEADEMDNLNIGEATSARIPVISYIVNNVSQPPRLPEDFQQDYDRTTSDSNVLTWTYDSPCSAFIIYKQFDFPVGGGLQEVARIEPGDSTHYVIKYDDEGNPYKEFYFVDTNLSPYTEYQYAIQVERLVPPPPLSTPSALLTARTKADDGYPKITISESDDEQDGTLLVYPDKNAYLTVAVTGPSGQTINNYYSVVQYQWQKQEKGAWVDLIGETDKTLTFASAGVDSAGDYRCRVNVITKGSNAAITAYSDFVTLTHDKRTSYFGELSVTDVPGGGVQLYAQICNAHGDSASIPGGTVTFNLTSNVTGQTYQFTTVLSAAGTAVAVLDQVLPEGMYAVDAYYSGSYIFKSCTDKTLYLSQRATGYDIDLPATVTYGDEAEIIFREVSKAAGVTSMQDIDASAITMYLAARMSRAAVSGSVEFTGTAVKGRKYWYSIEGTRWYFTAPVAGTPTFDAANGYALFGEDVSATYITPQIETGKYILQAGTPAGVYLISMKATEDSPAAYAAIEVLPRAVTLQIPVDTIVGESATESADDITISMLSIISGSWADCDIVGDVFKYANTSISPKYYNTAGTEFTASTVRKLCGSYSVVGTAQLPNYNITYRTGQLTVLGAAFDVSVGARPFDGLDVGRVYMLTPETGVATGPLSSDGAMTTNVQAGVRMVFSAQPDNGYEIYDWYINGQSQGSRSTTFVYTMLAEETTVEVQFAIRQNTITFGVAGDEGGGTITCSDASLASGSVVRQNSRFFFTAQANEGFHFKEWRYTEQGQGTSYDDEDYGEQTSEFEFFMPGISCSLYAVFERDGYIFNYIDGNNAYGLTATYVDDAGEVATIKSGARVTGGTEITVKPAAGYEWDLSRQYVSQGTQGVADYAAGTYVLSIDDNTTVYGWTVQQRFALTLTYDYTRRSEMVPDAVITYIIGDRDYSFTCEEFLSDGSKVVENVPGGSPVSVSIDYPGWIVFDGWTGSGTTLTATTEVDPRAVTVAVGDTVGKNRYYFYTVGADKYFFVSPLNGTVKSLDGENVVLYSSASTYTIPALGGDETLTVGLREKPVYTVELKDISASGTYKYTLPEGGFEGSSALFINVHEGDDFTVMVTPNQGKTVSYWMTLPQGGSPVTRPATSLRYTIPSVDNNYYFEPIFSSTTYNLVSWPTISESQNGLSVNPESGYIASVAAGGDFKFTLSGKSLPLVKYVYANGNQFTSGGGTTVGETKYVYDETTGVYSILGLTENQEITVSFKTIGVTVNDVDISALSGTGWTYDPDKQLLTLTRTGLTLSGSNDQSIAPNLHITATDAVGALTLDSLNVVSTSGDPLLNIEANVILTAAGKSSLKASVSDMAIFAKSDLTVRGNGSLNVSGVVNVAYDMQVVGTVDLTISDDNMTAFRFILLQVGNTLTVSASNSPTSSPVLRVTENVYSCVYAVNGIVVYGGEASFSGAQYGVLTVGNVYVYDGILELYGGTKAFSRTGNTSEPSYVYACYDKGYMCRVQLESGSYQSYTRMSSQYSGSGSDMIAKSYGTILDGWLSGWGNSAQIKNTYIRLSPQTSTASDTGLMLSVKYNGVVYTTEQPLASTTQLANLYYIVPGSEDHLIKYIDFLELYFAGMDDEPLGIDENAIVVAEFALGNRLYFTRMKINEQAITYTIPGGENQPDEEHTTYYYTVDIINDADPLDFTVSGSISPSVNDDTLGGIFADGTVFNLSSSSETPGTQQVKTLTLDNLTHVRLKASCPVILKGNNYLIGTKNAEPLTASGAFELSSDGNGTLTVTASRNGDFNKYTALNLDGSLILRDVAALTLISETNALTLTSDTSSQTPPCVKYYSGEIELPYGFGWAQDLGSRVGDAVTQDNVDAEPEEHYVKFYVTSTDAVADPAALVFDKSDAALCVTETEITPLTEMGVPHLFTPDATEGGCKVMLVKDSTSTGSTPLILNADYTYLADEGGLTGALTFDYSTAAFKDLPVGEYVIRVFFYDEDGTDATFYTLDIPFTVQDIEHVTIGLSATANVTTLTRGKSANITTTFTGPTPKAYVWTLVDKDNNEVPAIDGIVLNPSGTSTSSTASIAIHENALNGEFSVKVYSYSSADTIEANQLYWASVDFSVVPKVVSIAIICDTETPSGDESYMLNHNTLDGSVRSWDFDAIVTMDDGEPADPDRVSWRVWGGTMSRTEVDQNGLLSINPNETGLNDNGFLLLYAKYTNEDDSYLEKVIKIRLSDNAIVGYTPDSDGGTISAPGIEPNGTPVPANTSVTFTATPAEGQAIDTWFVNGQAVADGDAFVIGENTLTFTTAKMGRYSVWATFSGEKICTVTYSAEGPGSVSAETDSGTLESGAAVAKGTAVTFTAVPDTLAAITSWTVNGEVVENNTGDTLTLGDVQGPVEVVVTFEVPERTVTVTADANGSVNFLVNGEPSDKVTKADDAEVYTLTVLSTDTVTILAVPNEGYVVKEWSVLTNATASDAICTVLPDLADAAATVVFEPVPTYTVTVYANAYENGCGTVEGGTKTVPMSGSDTFTVTEGGSIAFTAIPDAGSTLYDWVVEPGTYTDYAVDADEITLKNVVSDLNVIATFRRAKVDLAVGTEGDGTLRADYELTVGTVELEDGFVSAPGSDTEVTLWSGAKVTVTVTPNAGQFLASFTVNGEEKIGELVKAEDAVVYTCVIDPLTENTEIIADFDELILYEVTGHLDYTEEVEAEDPAGGESGGESGGTVIKTKGTVAITEYGAANGFNTLTPATAETETEPAVPQKASVTPGTVVEITFAPGEGYEVDTDVLSEGVRAVLTAAGSEATFTFKQSADGVILRLEGVDKDLDFSELPDPFVAIPEDEEFFTLTIASGENGTLTVVNNADRVQYMNGASVKKGTELTYTATPDDHFRAEVTVDNEPADASGTLTMEAALSISAVFTQDQFRVTVTVAGKGSGTVLVNGEEYDPDDNWYDDGTEVSIEVLPADDSAADTFMIDGQSVDDASATVTIDGKDVAVTVSFSNAMRPVTYNDPDNGTLKVIDAQGSEVANNSAQRIGSKMYVITVPDPHYTLETETVGGTELNADYFSVDERRGNNVYAEFSRSEVSVSWSSTNSTVDAQLMPNGDSITNGQYVPVGSMIAFVVTPKSDNYSQDTFTVSGAAQNEHGWYVADQQDIVANAVYKYTGDAPHDGVTVTMLPTGCTITAELEDGTPVANGDRVQPGSRIKFTVTPLGSDYIKESFTVLHATDEGDGYYLVGDQDVVVSAVYNKQNSGPVTPPPPAGSYTVMIEVEGNGNLSVANNGAEVVSGDKVALGSVLTIDAYPGEGAKLISLTVNGVEFENGEEYVVYANSIIRAEFGKGDQSGLPCYVDSNGNVVFISFAYDLDGDGFISEDEYIAPDGAEIIYRENTKYFEDMPGNWSDEYIQFVGDRQIMIGVTDTQFDPEGKVTRNQFVTVLGRMYERSFSGVVDSGTHDFTDVDYSATSWYGKYVDWAARAGLILGYGDGRFGPEDYVTREQMAVIIYRFAKFLEADTSAAAQLTYSDSASISEWAVDALKYCVGEGIISGNNNGAFEPQKEATRVQMATVIVRFIKSVLSR